MEDASGRKLYICLRCGNRFWSRAKKPQCSVCKSKRVMLYEDFLKLPQEEQEKILGKRRPEKEEKVEAAGLKEGETGGKEVNLEVEEEKLEVKREEKPVKSGESPKITHGESVKKGDSPKIPRVKRGEKPGERVKGEGVNKLKIPRLSWKGVAVLVGTAVVYYLYKTGWFDSVFESLKRLGGEEQEPEEDKPVVRSSPILRKIERNLGRG